MINVDTGTPSPEVYSEKPILFRTEGTGALLFGSDEYHAGRGNAPAVGDEMVLSVLGPQAYRHEGREKVAVPRSLYLDGVYAVIDVQDGDIASPFFKKPTDKKAEFWGLTVRKVREIEHEDEIDRTEQASLLSMI